MEIQLQLSIVIATFSHGRFREQAVDNALTHSFDPINFELIVVDDGSTDDTPDRLMKYEGRIHAIRQQNQSELVAYQTDIQAARG